MVVDAQLGQFGDLLFESALGVYVLAMILHAVEHALLRRPARAEESAREPVGAAVGGGSTGTPT